MTNGTWKPNNKRFKRGGKKIKKHTQKKTYKNKKYNKKSYGMRKLSSLKSKMSMLNRLYKLNTQSFYIGFREVNPLSSVGKMSLTNDFTTDKRPVHLYPLSLIKQSASAEIGCYELTQDNHDFSTNGVIEQMGSNGNTIQDIQNIKVRKLLHNYSDIRLCLRGQDTRKVKFTCYLVQFKDESFDVPRLNTVSGSTDQNRRSSFFGHLVRQNLNPCIKNEDVLTDDVKKMFRIVWKKEYTIREKLSTEDENQYKIVKIFRQHNKILSFTSDGNPEVIDDVNDNVEQVDLSTITFRNYPSLQDNLFLIVCGDCIDNGTSQTYDINIKNKFTSSERLSQT